MTLTVTCPHCREKFAVVEPKNETAPSLTVECPGCLEAFAVVYPREAEPSETEAEPSLDTREYEMYLGEFVEGPVQRNAETPEVPSPYTGSDTDIPVAQYVTGEINGIGGKEGGVDIAEALEPDRFMFWYTPEHNAYSYVVRANLETGVKSKNIEVDDKGELYFTNRGVPRDGSDKQWTYLSREECERRAEQAQLDRVEADPDASSTNRFRIYLGATEQPLVDDDGTFATNLLLQMARGLVAFQTKRWK